MNLLHALFLCTTLPLLLAEKYQPTWESLESRPLPEWYDRDKFGIFIHWGVYSVPPFSEWFWYNWREKQDPVALKFMKNNYKPNFTYQDFARDFTAELFNATEWARMFEKSGARYVVLTSKHHDGYTMWPSKYSYSWNSVDVGPHRDIVGELAAAIRNSTDLRFGLYYSLYEWFNQIYIDDRNTKFTTRHFPDTKTTPELHDLVNTYKPEVIWTDGEWEALDDYWQAKQFIAWLYNESPVKDTVLVNDRWGLNTLGKHGGFLTVADRYNPKTRQRRKWENAMTIERSWAYRQSSNLEYYMTSQEVIHTLIETVSCGGNLLLNVGPTSYGKITPIFEERLLDVGKWLKVNGEVIYDTQPWSICLNDTLNPNIWYTEGKGPVLYAIILEWPRTGNISMECVAKLDNLTTIEFIGGLETPELSWTRINDTIEVTLPNKAEVRMEWAWSLKIINGTKPINTAVQ